MNASATTRAVPLRSTLVALALAALSALAGCAKVRPPVEPREDVHPWPQIQLDDRELAGKIAVRQPLVQRDSAGLLFVTVPVRSTTRHQITIEYQSVFYDRDHAPIFESTWFPTTRTPVTQTPTAANSTSNRAEDFQINIRQAR